MVNFSEHFPENLFKIEFNKLKRNKNRAKKVTI